MRSKSAIRALFKCLPEEVTQRIYLNKFGPKGISDWEIHELEMQLNLTGYALLRCWFRWNKTVEGFEFWSKIYAALVLYDTREKLLFRGPMFIALIPEPSFTITEAMELLRVKLETFSTANTSEKL